ncbi:proline-specific peptidase [Mollisia scopiformis]|uniref:Proline-specific peptidase n=1 Tax=Mollisia scopiformis TaxID=149040 RepID=A0A132BB89_MOLSC|nr:proline-specific peptidase [Mollisia scopiformis]KUJ09533.1 proline-specific peptidase [Mollisia scopiformis]
MAAIPVIESEVDFHVEGAGKPCKTWYTIFGILPSPDGVRPLVIMHGGPGVPHDVLRPLQNLWRTHRIPVIMYDQLGCGRSTHLPEKLGDGSFWTVQLFILELDNLLGHLGVQDDYDILGQSWGGCLAAEHAVLHPQGLRRLVLSSSPASKPDLMLASQKLRDQLPSDIQEALIKNEDAGTLDDPQYKQAKMFYFSQHLCRLKPFPDVLMASLKGLIEKTLSWKTRNGPYLFKRTGSTKDWSIKDRVHEISVPTLLLNGYYDPTTDSTMEPFFKGIKNKVERVKFEHSGHFAHLEEPEAYLQVVGDFLIKNGSKVE